MTTKVINAYTVILHYGAHKETVTDVTQVDNAENTMILWRLHGAPVSVRIPDRVEVFGPKIESENIEYDY